MNLCYSIQIEYVLQKIIVIWIIDPRSVIFLKRS